MRTALIAGGSGLVGRYLVDLLTGSTEFARIVAVGRRPLDVEHPKLAEVVTGFDALERVSPALRADVAFCCLGTTMKKAGSREAFRAVDQGAVLAFAWAAQRGGVRQFHVVSSLGADANSRVFYSRVKGETERALQVMGFASLGIFRPSLLLGPRAEFRFTERLAGAALALTGPLWVGRLRRYRAIHAAVVARAMLRASLDPRGAGAEIFESDAIQALGRRAEPRASL